MRNADPGIGKGGLVEVERENHITNRFSFQSAFARFLEGIRLGEDIEGGFIALSEDEKVGSLPQFHGGITKQVIDAE
jgi:hypothetical protein